MPSPRVVTALTHAQRAERRESIAEKVRQGLSPAAVAREFGVSLGTVYLACRTHGVKPRPRDPLKDGRSKVPVRQRTLAVLAQLAQTSRTLSEIATMHDLSVERVRQLMLYAHEAGFKFPHRKNKGVNHA